MRTWTRSSGGGWIRTLRARCWACDMKWRARLHIANRVAWALLFLAFAFGPVVLRLWHARGRQ